MARPMLLIGLGGFGKWVVTAFKTKILDTYGKKPENIDWLSFDLIEQERPEVKYTRFELGRLKEETLDFSDTSNEFVKFTGDVQSEIDKARNNRSDIRFIGRLTEEDANLFIKSDESGLPAAERRHISMIQFIKDIEKINRVLTQKLKANSLVFVVNSIAGGTGTGTFIDFLLLLRNHLATLKGTLINILFLPYGFTKVKKNEDMDPLYANCYASFREFLRLFYPRGNVRVSYSLTDLSLQNITKRTDTISDVVYIIDGSKIGGVEGSRIEYFHGVVPAIATFIENSFLATLAEEEKKAATRTETSFDQAKAHALQNFKTPKADDNPYNSLSFASFGSYRLIFDTEAIKTEFAQRIAIKIFGEDQFLAPSWITDPEAFVKNYTLNVQESTQFDRLILHDCVTKYHQISNFATYRSLKTRLEGDVKFPEFAFSNIKIGGRVQDIEPIINTNEQNELGTPSDEYKPRRINTFYGVYNYYLNYYPAKFQECIKRKVLAILSKEYGTDNYGKGSLKAAEGFIRALIIWYTDFLKGIPEGAKAKFTLACESADSLEGTYENWKKIAEDYYQANAPRRGKKLGIFGPDKRKEYLQLRVKAHELRKRNILGELIIKIAAKNLEYLEGLHQKINDWIFTFEECKKTMERSLGDLLEVRNARKEIACDEYLTDSQDIIEKEFFDLITNYEKWENTKKSTSPDGFIIRLKELLPAIPHPRWSDILKGFTWQFNQEKGKGYHSPKHPIGDLVCFVESEMPDFPTREEWERKEYINTWNYKLVEYYLTYHKLNELDNISAFGILMLRGDEPEEVLDKLKRNSEKILFVDEGRVNSLIDEEYSAFKREFYYFITADFGYKSQPTLEKWISSFNEKINALGEKGITKVDTKEKPHEIIFTKSEFCIPSSAIINLANSEGAYRQRMRKKIPPPLHLFKGEKEAFKYEEKIEKRFKTGYEKLHPQVVSLLEKDELVRLFLLADSLNLIKPQEKSRTQEKRCYYKIGNGKFYGKEGRFPFVSDVLYELIYPPEEKATMDKNLMETLGKEVNTEWSKKDEERRKDVIKTQVRKLESELKKDLPKKEKDLYKVWIVMLEEELQ